MRRRKSLRATASRLALPTRSREAIRGGLEAMKGVATVRSPARVRALPLDHHLEIFAGQDQRCVPRAIAPLDHLEQLAGERRLPLRIGVELREGLVDRAIPGAEDLDEVLRRPVAEEEMAADRVDGQRLAEELVETLAHAPERGGLQAGGRRQVLADNLEHLSDEARGSPVGETD